MLRDVSLTADAGAITMLVGQSGSGKTTLLKLCKGLLAPRAGSISVLGAPVVARARGRLDPTTAYIPQQLGLVRSASVLDNVLVGALSRAPALRSLLKAIPDEESERARELLARFGIGHKASHKAYALSGGERQRVAIARALMQGARVLLADEFVSQLDPLTSSETMAIVRGIADAGVAVLATTHEMEIVRGYADRVIVLRAGEKVADVRGGAAAMGDVARVMRA